VWTLDSRRMQKKSGLRRVLQQDVRMLPDLETADLRLLEKLLI